MSEQNTLQDNFQAILKKLEQNATDFFEGVAEASVGKAEICATARNLSRFRCRATSPPTKMHKPNGGIIPDTAKRFRENALVLNSCFLSDVRIWINSHSCRCVFWAIRFISRTLL